MESIFSKLEDGDRRSIGRVNEVVAEVASNPVLFDVLFEGMLYEDLVPQMRCADAVEKITADHPEYLRRYKERLIGEVARINQKEVRWHVAQMLSRLENSKIVKTFSMQTLGNLPKETSAFGPRSLTCWNN